MNNEDGYDVESTGAPDHGDDQGVHPEDDHSKLSEDNPDAPDRETAGAERSPHDLEPLDDEPAPKLDLGSVCPHCNAPAQRPNGPCMRCGKEVAEPLAGEDVGEFYRKGSSATSAVGDAVGAFERAEDDRDIPISGPGRGGYLLPAALALFCIAITLGGYFVGAHALFPGVDDPELTISVGWRFLGLLRYLALVVFLVGCGLVSLALVTVLLRVEFGDLSLATIRMFSCVAAMRLVAFISIATTFLESLVELLTGIAIVLLLMIVYFRIKIQEACLFLGMSVLCVFLIWITAYFVIWVMMG